MTSKRLAEAQRLLQIALEHHRRDPDSFTWDEFLREKKGRDTEWLRHITR
jgi:hypothetical protein